MYTLTKQIAAVLLILGSIRDIRKRSLPVWTLYAVEILVMIWGVWKQEVVWWEIAGGILIGAVFLGISKWTGEALGYADSGLILILGSYLGMWNLMILLLIAFSVAAFYAAMGMVIGNFHRKFSVPFIPFLTLGYLWVVFLC